MCCVKGKKIEWGIANSPSARHQVLPEHGFMQGDKTYRSNHSDKWVSVAQTCRLAGLNTCSDNGTLWVMLCGITRLCKKS